MLGGVGTDAPPSGRWPSFRAFLQGPADQYRRPRRKGGPDTDNSGER
jgi:hypothetical protein